MFSLNESLHYYLYPYYINMGCGIEILSELVRNTKTGNPLSGDVYLFCGKKRDMIKLLRWQEDGFILYKYFAAGRTIRIFKAWITSGLPSYWKTS